MTNKWKALLAVFSLVITIGLLTYTSREIPVREVTQHDAIAEVAAGRYRLIDLEGLRSLCEDPSTALLLVNTRLDQKRIKTPRTADK